MLEYKEYKELSLFRTPVMAGQREEPLEMHGKSTMENANLKTNQH